MRVVISSGHGKYIRGAAGPKPWGLDEVDEARHVVETVADDLTDVGVEVDVYHDDVSQSQDENLKRIVDYHNSRGPHDLDVSVHFNAYETTSKPMGTECLYVSQEELADVVAAAVAAAADLPDRGPKKRTDLYFLNNTEAPAILIETCFVDSQADAEHYRQRFHEICAAIAGAISGEEIEDDDRPERPERPEKPEGEVLFEATGRCSWFGGPTDDGVSPSEELAWLEGESGLEAQPYLFLPYQPEGTSGLARRLNPYVHFVACRWDYDVTSKAMLRDSGQVALVRNTRTGQALTAIPADWGPHEQETGRAADLSLSLLKDLGLETDDEVEVIYPYVEED